MRSIITVYHVYFFLILLSIYFILIIHGNFSRFASPILRTVGNKFYCVQWQPIDEQLCTTNLCTSSTKINTIIWTHDGTGLMKYIQWFIIRKFGNIKITQFDENCCIIEENDFISNSTTNTFLQIYIISLTADLSEQSVCSNKINRTLHTRIGYINHIYFKRKSFLATVVYHQLDLMRHKNSSEFNSGISSFRKIIEKAMKIVRHFPNYFLINSSIKWKIIDSEDLIYSNLTDCETTLDDFLSLLGYNTSTNNLQNIIRYDSHRFIEDATWWDQSDVAQSFVTRSIPPHPTDLTYSNDFYYLHGNRTFPQYLSDNRQCYNDGIFAQMQSETIPNRTSIDGPNHCLSKSSDCAFSDLYSFHDREELYDRTNKKPLKCGLAIPSIFDKVRKRYARNQTCQTIIFTSIINCYDTLPGVSNINVPSVCFIALVDNRSYHSPYIRRTRGDVDSWELINLGSDVSLFRFPAKIVETLKALGQRIFPLAKWIIWLDGKSLLLNIHELLIHANASVFAPRHNEITRTSASEVNSTIERIRDREKSFSKIFNDTVFDIKRQEKEYQRDGFYARSDVLNVKMFDIALFLYRNNHPCNFRYLCGWHNEINYFAYRGQLSVYYSAVRLNLTKHLQFLPRKYYHTYGHTTIC